MYKRPGVIILLACLPTCLLADFSYEETTKITGGMMAGMMKFAGAFSKQAREPLQSTVAVKGNRMLHGNKDRASVIDLDSETITEINYQKKTYSVMTFAEMKQAMEQAMQRMKNAPPPQQQQESQGQKPDVKTDFKVDIKETGQSKEIGGLQTKEVVLTMKLEGTDQQSGNKGAMVVISDMWLAAKIPGYDEIAKFHRRMGEKMAWTPDSGSMNAMMGRPDMARAMENMRKEGSKMNGTPVLTVMKMTGSAEGQPTENSDTQTSSQQSKPQPAKPDLGTLLGGKFGGFGRKKKQDDSQSSSTPPPSNDASGSGSLMEMTTETTGFSSAPVDPSRFSPPAGFKKVESEMAKHQRQ
jgi:carbon monoxide dehydrogenase subunit G